MDLTYSPEELAFQREVRAWLKANVPSKDRSENPVEGAPDKQKVARGKAWQRKVFEAGYLAMGWPTQYGGQGADVMRQTIVNEEMVRARAPGLIGMMGIQMVGPTLIAHGTEEQRQRYLPKILTADDIWCQGYSEPGSGSDLASLRTRAEIVGDEFVVNGQKIWTSGAQYADWMFCLVRTDPAAPKHRGISYVLIDMKSPGITVRPLVQMTGDPGFNEVFFEDVRVPRANLVGQLHDGWTVANATLFHERNMLASDRAHAAPVPEPRPPGAEAAARRQAGDGRPPGAATARRPRDPGRDHEARGVPPADRHAPQARPGHQRVGEQARHVRAEPSDLARRTRDSRRLRLAREEGCPRRRRRHVAERLHVRARRSSSAAARRRSRRTSSPSAASACPGTARTAVDSGGRP